LRAIGFALLGFVNLPLRLDLSSAEKIELASSGFDVQATTRLPPLASSDDERLAVALAAIGRLHAELRLHRVLDEIEQMLRRCDEIEHLLFLATPAATLPR
jgi:hypothetical protein